MPSNSSIILASRKYNVPTLPFILFPQLDQLSPYDRLVSVWLHVSGKADFTQSQYVGVSVSTLLIILRALANPGSSYSCANWLSAL